MAKHSSKDWKAARVHVDTLARLEAVRKQLEAGHEMGKRFLEIDHRNERIGMDQTIRYLLWEWERHNERRRTAAKKK